MNRKIVELAERFLGETAALRHELHKIPELAGKEYKTSALLRERLGALNLKVEKPYLETDVAALLNADSPGRNVTLRADIDALPVMEESPLPYRSQHPGTMHACGHDGHMAMLYGAARILSELRAELPGSVRFLFQPGEEIAALAKPLLEAGAAFDEVITIGPLVMMKFVAQATKPYGVKTVASMNPIMVDGTGMCGGCRVTVGGETKFACVDGPDFDAHLIDFDEAIKRSRLYAEFEREAREAHCNLYKKEVT